MNARSKLLVELALAKSTKEREDDNSLCSHKLQQPSTSTNNTTGKFHS